MFGLSLVFVISTIAAFRLQVFCEVAYKAQGRQDLLDGMDEYIDDLTVLPPSIWDPSNRLEPPNDTISMVTQIRCYGCFANNLN